MPAQPGLDPIIVYFEDVSKGQGRVTLICYDMAWTGYWAAIGDRTIKQFFLDGGADYLAGNITSGRQYKQDKQSQAYVLKVINAAQSAIRNNLETV